MKQLFVFYFILLAGCQSNAMYSLSETEVNIEVNDQDFDPLDYVRKNGEPLEDSERKAMKTGAKINVEELGDYTFRFPEHQLSLNVHIRDTQPPELSLLGFKIEEGVVFTWNDETKAKLKPQIKDNYDTADLVKKSLRCDSVDTSKLGKQIVKCYVEDSSGNKGSSDVELEVVAKNEAL